jgi:tRNA(fMet)-specific endonuclease VapC
MNLFVLDTDILTLFQNGHAAVVRQVQSHSVGELAVSIISVEEELTGWYTKVRQAKKPAEMARVYQRLTDTVRFVSQFQLLSFSLQAITLYERLRTSFRRMSKNDLRIASVTLENDAILVTRNVRDFRQVPGLQVEDWSK